MMGRIPMKWPLIFSATAYGPKSRKKFDKEERDRCSPGARRQVRCRSAGDGRLWAFTDLEVRRRRHDAVFLGKDSSTDADVSIEPRR